MIKILFFIETLEGGGAEKVLRNLVNNMDQTKFDITVQTVWPCDFEKYLVKGIKHKSMYSVRNSVNGLRYRVEAETGLAYKLHIKDDYDIECAYLEMGATKVMAASTNKKAKKLAWVHCDFMRKSNDPRAFAETAKKYYEKFDHVICVAESVRDSFIELFGNEINSVVLHNTIDDEEIKNKAKQELPAECKKRRLTALAIGTMYGPKNYERLLRAHKMLNDESIEHDLWIVGEGPDRLKLEKFVSTNNIEDSVYMPGFKNNPYPYIKAADLLVCSSNYEGFSTFITEGMILGKPVVTTECSGMREILGDSEYGLITKNEDEAFTAGFRKMLVDAELRKKYSHNAEERGAKFSKRNLVNETETFLMEVIK